jgi:hypothetical protein
VVETQTTGLGPDSLTLEAVLTEVTCSIIFFLKDILIGCDLTNRSCSYSSKIDNLRLGIQPDQQSEGTQNKGDLIRRKGIIRLLNIYPT